MNSKRTARSFRRWSTGNYCRLPFRTEWFYNAQGVSQQELTTVASSFIHRRSLGSAGGTCHKGDTHSVNRWEEDEVALGTYSFRLGEREGRILGTGFRWFIFFMFLLPRRHGSLLWYPGQLPLCTVCCQYR